MEGRKAIGKAPFEGDQPVPAIYLKKKFRRRFVQHGLASVFGKDLRGTAAASLGYIDIQDEREPFFG